MSARDITALDLALRFDQAFRAQHCSHSDRASVTHRCTGSVTVTPAGTALTCPQCGSGTEAVFPPDPDADAILLAVCNAAGLDYDALRPERRASARAALRRLWCAGEAGPASSVHRFEPEVA